MWWTTSSGLIELNITKKQAAQGSHRGRCDDDIAELRKVPGVRRQLDKIDPNVLARELLEYGAWSECELSDHSANLDRILWLVCGDIVEGNI